LPAKYNNESSICSVDVLSVVELPNTVRFPVGEPLFWIECLTTTNPGRSYYDPVEAVVKPFPPFPVIEQ